MNKQERAEKLELYGQGYQLLLETLKDIPQEMWDALEAMIKAKKSN